MGETLKEIDPRENSIQRQVAIERMVEAFNNPNPTTKTPDQVRTEVQALIDEGITVEMYKPLLRRLDEQQLKAERLWMLTQALKLFDAQSK
jgi:hypothetical protein